MKNDPDKWRKLRRVARNVYANLAEQAGGTLRATTTICSLATVEKVSTRTVQRALRELTAAELIRVYPTEGGPSTFEFPNPFATPQTFVTPDKLRVTPDKKTVTPDREQGELLPVLVAANAEVIYLQYPRKVARTDALAAINKVLRAGKVPPSELLQKTQQFARATSKWGSGDKQFIPHPATWYNRGSYDDDPATWERNYARQGQRPATTQDEHANGF